MFSSICQYIVSTFLIAIISLSTKDDDFQLDWSLLTQPSCGTVTTHPSIRLRSLLQIHCASTAAHNPSRLHIGNSVNTRVAIDDKLSILYHLRSWLTDLCTCSPASRIAPWTLSGLLRSRSLTVCNCHLSCLRIGLKSSGERVFLCVPCGDEGEELALLRRALMMAFSRSRTAKCNAASMRDCEVSVSTACRANAYHSFACNGGASIAAIMIGENKALVRVNAPSGLPED